MITQLNIRGFKSLADVDVELGQVNVFIGANGSGKSNLLESLGLCQSFTQSRMKSGERSVLQRNLFSSFRNMNISDKINVTIFKENTAFTFPFTGHDHIVCHLNENTGFDDDEDYIFKSIRDYAIFSPDTPFLRGITPDITQRIPLGLAGGRLAEAVEDLLDNEKKRFGTLELDELFELLDWVEEIAIVPPSRDLVAADVPTLRSIIRFTDRWMRKDQNQFSAYEASEGALYVLFVLVLAMHPESPKIFAIDNFDHAMHPRLARATTRIFSRELLKTDRQALLTTHNPLVLDGLNLSDDRIRLFAVERNSYGATKIYRIQVSEEILQATQQGLSLSNLWIMGRLGGVPDIF